MGPGALIPFALWPLFFSFRSFLLSPSCAAAAKTLDMAPHWKNSNLKMLAHCLGWKWCSRLTRGYCVYLMRHWKGILDISAPCNHYIVTTNKSRVTKPSWGETTMTSLLEVRGTRPVLYTSGSDAWTVWANWTTSGFLFCHISETMQGQDNPRTESFMLCGTATACTLQYGLMWVQRELIMEKRAQQYMLSDMSSSRLQQAQLQPR